MAQVDVTIGSRSYTLACRDGDEDRLRRLAAHVGRKSDDVVASLGQMSEPRLLLMAGIMVADELFELRERGGMPADDGALDAVAARIEAIAAALERDGRKA